MMAAHFGDGIMVYGSSRIIISTASYRRKSMVSGLLITGIDEIIYDPISLQRARTAR